SHVTVYTRGEAAVTTADEPFRPFLLLADPDLLKEFKGDAEVTPLDGAGVYRWLAECPSWSEALRVRDHCLRVSGKAGGAPDAPYRFLNDPVHQFLLRSGKTSFLGMGFGDLRRMALDIEVTTAPGFEFPNAARDSDRIIAIAMADSTGFSTVLSGALMSEAQLLAECSRILRERDPDVLEGHNIFRFDLEYMEARARRHRVRLAWGRDGSELRSRPARLQVAERSIGYRRYEIAGRHIADTWMLAQLHDVGARDLPSFGLKDIARHLGVAAADRTYIDASAIARELAEAPERLMAYAADDAVETLAIGAILAPPYFVQAQLLPFDYQAAALRGAAAKIDALLVREYLRRGHAIPAPGASQSVSGGLTAIWRQGVGGPVLHVDVTSLYPSLMLAERVAPASDELGVFLALLDHLRDVRVSAKRLARTAAEAEERRHQHAMQQTFKILINAFYGYLAFGSGHFNDFAAADRVTTEGRRVVTAIVDRLTELGATPIEADTDGVYFLAPPGHLAADDAALLETIAAGLPEGIALELDARHAAMLSYKMKTYALLDDRGRVQLKGSGFRSRGLEPFQRRVIEEVVRLLLEGKRGEVRAVIDRWLTAFSTHQVPIRQFARTETLQEAVDVYRQRVQASLRAPSAAYELMIATGRACQPGDQVSYYVAGRSRNVVVNEQARLASEWDPARPDENVEHYQGKVLEIWDRFRRFTESEGLVPYRDESAEDEAQLSLF
ncbi:MAG TPA: DNA polymerase domain-containing protein, partial [Candidatus Acidoferrum sp.]|nr:DNA polymerase domain-containing protein [Candidatus Acidoferrum sp.]